MKQAISQVSNAEATSLKDASKPFGTDRMPSLKSKETIDELLDFNRTKLAFNDQEVFLVEGIWATFEKRPTEKPIKVLNGFYVYKTES